MLYIHKKMLNISSSIFIRSFHHFSTNKNYSSTLHVDIANQLRIDCLRAIHVTKSGHPTSCSSIAEILSVLFFHCSGIKLFVGSPEHFYNDRLILSKGHAAPILYSAFYRSGMISLQQLLSLRKKASIIQGHPVPTQGLQFIDAATGSLGMGLSIGAGMAYSSQYFDFGPRGEEGNRIFCIVGDGEMAEGNIWEGVDFGWKKKLGNFTVFVDVNRLGQSQETMFGHDMGIFRKRFQAFGWNAIVIDGHDVQQIVKALNRAREEKERPTAIICKTFKGKNFGKQIENKDNWHGKDLGQKQQQVIAHLKSLMTQKQDQLKFQTYPPIVPQNPLIPHKNTDISIKPSYKPNSKISTRKAFGQALVKAQKNSPNLISLDGDTKNSTFSCLLSESSPSSFIECFIAQQNMIAVAIGLSARKKLPICSSFASFLTRGVDQIRLASISSSNLIVVGTHTGCSIGEDGPTQMGLEDLAIMKALAQIVLVPSDGVSMERGMQILVGLGDKKGVKYVRAGRMDVGVLYRNQEVFEIGKCKILRQSQKDEVLVISHGVTIHQCLKAYESLLKKQIKIRIIDIFSLKPLDIQTISSSLLSCNGNLLIVQQHYKSGGAYDTICGQLIAHNYNTSGSIPSPSTSPSLINSPNNIPSQNILIKNSRHLYVKNIPGSATPEEQLQIAGLDWKNIQNVVLDMVNK